MSANQSNDSFIVISPKISIRLSHLLLALGIIAHITLAVYFNFTQDDAFITFRYAANYLNGDGLVYNIGERIEGYTNFLWLIFMIMGKLAGVDFVIFSRIAGIFCGVGTIFFTWLIGRIIFERHSYLPGLCSLILGTVLSFAYWSAAGLETAAFSMMAVGVIYFYLKRSYGIIVFLVLATLLRPEGGLVLGIIVFHNIVSAKSFTKYATTVLAAYAILLVPYAIFKWIYFGALLPNPFYAKTGFDLRQLYNGLEYTGTFFWHYLAGGLFVLPFLLSYKKWSRSIRMVAIFLLIYVVYIALIGGDVLKVHRFFVPLFPGIILITVYGLSNILKNKLLFIGSVLLLIGWQIYEPLDHITSFHRSEKGLVNKMNYITYILSRIDGSNYSLATSTIGVVGYRLLGHEVIDLLGLTDSTIARHPEQPIEMIKTTWKEEKYNSKYLLSRQPDYIMFSTSLKPSAPAEQALFLYSQFLNSYRVIGIPLGDVPFDIYKRYFPIVGSIESDVDPELVYRYNLALNQRDNMDYSGGIKNLRRALELCPEPKYPYIYSQLYYMEWAERDLRVYYSRLKEMETQDTLNYYVYKDLYLYESNVNMDFERAGFYRNKLMSLVPWYLTQLDSVIETYHRELRKYNNRESTP